MTALLRLREDRRLTQDYTAGKGQSQDSNKDLLLIQKSVLTITTLCSLLFCCPPNEMHFYLLIHSLNQQMFDVP